MVRRVEALADRLLDRVLPKAEAEAACASCPAGRTCTVVCCISGSSLRWVRCCWEYPASASSVRPPCICRPLDYC